MDIKSHNKKVAIIRWNKIHKKEKALINNNPILKARICGYLAGDGNILIRKLNNNPTHYITRFYPDHISLVNSFREAFIKIYKKEPKIKDNGNFFSLTIYSKIVVEDLLKLGNFGKLEWRAPMKILKSKNAKKEWLRAIYDCEGYVGKKQIKIQTVNEKGIGDIKRLLNEFNIDSKNYIYQPKNKKWNIVYILIINKKSERIKFLNEIGFNHTSKMEKLKKIAAIA
ncbi:hypothetical protein HYU23_04760 [Candidatus Woesearchaeota archaeon]|nr:hypothetical protein [Candidatus Woesearchaeota archaeon]